MCIGQFYGKSILVALFATALIGCGSGDTEGGTDGANYVTSTAQENTTVQESEQTNSNQSSNSEDLNQNTVTAQTEAAPKVSLQGTISYDRIPFGSRSYSGLDYDAVAVMPARGVTVQALNSTGSVVKFTRTDASGFYAMDVDQNAQLKIRVIAELVSESMAAWDVQVKDNTKGNAVYVLEGSLASVGTNEQQTRDLHAQSGWVGNTYAETRAAGPFAILDSVYDAIQIVIAADNNVVLPPLNIFWSVNNIAISGSISEGNIGTSYYTSYGPSIYLLGAANNDSDEYDRAVIQHEFGHYLEHQIGRTESIGGSHSQTSKLDMRVAFGEAWGNAFSAMASGDPVYRDSLGANQALGFSVDVERKPYNNGWFSEASVQALLYDLFDGKNESSDNIELGFKAIYDVFTSEDYMDFTGFASVYSFIAELQAQNPNSSDEIAALMQNFDIYGTGWWGEGETNDADANITLPIYHSLSLGGTVEVCSDGDTQEYNGVDVRRFIRLNIATTDSYQITAVRSSGGLSRTNPQLRVFRQGNEITSSRSDSRNSETLTRSFSAGEYILEVYEQTNTDGISSTGGLACFEVALN